MMYSFTLSSTSAAGLAIRTAERGNPWEALALAVVTQAALDYQALYAYEVLRRRRYSHQPSQGSLVELERFFRGKWFQRLTTLDGDYLLRMLREKVEQEVLK